MPHGRMLIVLRLDGEAIDAKMVKYGLRTHHVLYTHGQSDHAGSASCFQNKYYSQVFVREASVHKLEQHLTTGRNIYPSPRMAMDSALVRGENQNLSEVLELFETSGKTQ